MQLQKDVPPETTCDAYTPLITSQSFVTRRMVWVGTANTQLSHRLHCVVSTSHARSQMIQGKRTQRWRLVVIALASTTRFRGIVTQEWDYRRSHLVVSSLSFVNQWTRPKRPDSYYAVLLFIFNHHNFGLSKIELKLVVGLNFTVTRRS